MVTKKYRSIWLWTAAYTCPETRFSLDKILERVSQVISTQNQKFGTWTGIFSLLHRFILKIYFVRRAEPYQLKGFLRCTEILVLNGALLEHVRPGDILSILNGVRCKTYSRIHRKSRIPCIRVPYQICTTCQKYITFNVHHPELGCFSLYIQLYNIIHSRYESTFQIKIFSTLKNKTYIKLNILVTFLH